MGMEIVGPSPLTNTSGTTLREGCGGSHGEEPDSVRGRHMEEGCQDIMKYVWVVANSGLLGFTAYSFFLFLMCAIISDILAKQYYCRHFQLFLQILHDAAGEAVLGGGHGR